MTTDAPAGPAGEAPTPAVPTQPVLAVVGRPNVGKSTLVNRILGRRAAVVEDVPGVTRDRVAYDADWRGRTFTVVDTGGWASDAAGLALRISQQAELAVASADAVLFVVDAVVGPTDADEAVVRVLRRAGKPVVLAANKVDDLRGEVDAAQLWSLGLGEPYSVSGLHGRGSGDLLDAVLDALPEAPPEREVVAGPRRVALLGRPNVGKSSLLNRLTGEERALVHDVAGTTRDPVDSDVLLDGEVWRFVDTAGIRRKHRQASGAEYYSTLRTAAALDASEVAVVLLDGSEPVAEADVRVIEQVVEAGRALVLAVNKWDLVDEDRRLGLNREWERDLGRYAWAPRINISALTGRGTQRFADTLRGALAGWEQRISTGRLNGFLGEVTGATPPPVRGGKQTRILFATQPGTAPPRFVLFTSGGFEAGYLRFLERRLREEFGFEGSPVQVVVRAREKRGKQR